MKPLSALVLDEKPVIAVRIQPAGVTTRRSFHLALLLDTSGSMHGEGITTLKRTLHLLIDEMVDGDILTLIEYNSVANAIAPTTELNVTTRPILHAAVDILDADGGTNLELGLVQLRETTGVTIDAVFILTDGHINLGIASTKGLQRLLAAAIPVGTPVNTLGYGANHNTRLLRDMALNSRGTYTYADAAEMIPAIIGDITGGLAAEVGRNARIILSDGWLPQEIGTTDDGIYTIGTLIADKTQWIVLEGNAIPAIPAIPAVHTLPTIRLEWCIGHDAVSAECIVTDVIPEIEVSEQRDRARVARAFHQLTNLLEFNQIDEARRLLEMLHNDLEASAAKDRTLVIRLRAQIDEMQETLRTMYSAAPVLHRHHTGLFIDDNIMGPILSRLAADTTTIGLQRGILSMQSDSSTTSNTTSLNPIELHHTFSSPTQQRSAYTMVRHFSQIDPE